MTKKVTARRDFLVGTAALIVAASSMPLKAAGQSTADVLRTMPQFIRELTATQIGVPLATINEWINSGEEDAQELMCDAIQILGERAKALLKQRRGGAS